MEREDGAWEEEVELVYKKYTFSSTLTMQHRPVRILDRGAVGLSAYGHAMDVTGQEAYTPGEQRISLGVFTFQEMPVSNLFRFQAGLRIDFQHTGARPNDQFPGINDQRNAVNLSGSVGMNHRPLPGVEVGGQVARSHRNPSVEELFADGIHLGGGVYEVGNTALKDEVGHGADFFIRYTGDRLEMEAAGFINYFRNFIIFQPTGETDPASGFPVFRYEGDEARLTGGEIRLGYTPSQGLSLNTGIDYVHGRRIRNGDDYLPFIPPFRFTAQAEYDFGRGWVGGKLLSAASQNRVAPEEDPTEGYTILGFTAGYRLSLSGRHVVILRADNLLNTRYRDHLSRIEDRNFPMPGRNIHLAYRWFF